MLAVNLWVEINARKLSEIVLSEVIHAMLSGHATGLQSFHVLWPFAIGIVCKPVVILSVLETGEKAWGHYIIDNGVISAW